MLTIWKEITPKMMRMSIKKKKSSATRGESSDEESTNSGDIEKRLSEIRKQKNEEADRTKEMDLDPYSSSDEEVQLVGEKVVDVPMTQPTQAEAVEAVSRPSQPYIHPYTDDRDITKAWRSMCIEKGWTPDTLASGRGPSIPWGNRESMSQLMNRVPYPSPVKTCAQLEVEEQQLKRKPSTGSEGEQSGKKAKRPPKQPAKQRTRYQLDPILKAFTFQFKDRLICGEEMNWRNKENPGPYTVAKFIEVGKKGTDNYRTIDLTKLKSEQLRELAQNFGCKGVGSSSMFECRQKLAIRKTAGTTYENLAIPNPVSVASEKKTNTYMRVLNTVFLNDFFPRFISLNENKSRADFEAAGGGSPVKRFWVDVSEFVNDTENNNGPVCLILESEEDGDPKMHELVTNGNFNLNDFNVTTYESCGQMVKDAMLANENIQHAMKQSGHHSNDPWDYCNRKHCTVRKKFMVPPEVAYYTNVLCRIR